VPEINRTATTTAQVRLSRRSPQYWRVTLDHPPLNIFGPDTIPQLDEVITAIEIDKDLRVVVFDSAVEGFFMTHYFDIVRSVVAASVSPVPSNACTAVWRQTAAP
jgi:hypothetical protein